MKTSITQTSAAALAAGAPASLAATVNEAIKNALIVHNEKEVGGTSGNPQMETVLLYEGGALTKWLSTGRGRKGNILVAVEGDDLKVALRMENHHNSRGWTIVLEARFYSENGELLNMARFKNGLKPKLWNSYKKKTKQFTLDDIAREVVYIQFTMHRESSKKFLGELAENVAKYGPKIVRAVNGDAKAMAELALDIHMDT